MFQEDDDRFYVGVSRTRSGRFVEITTASKVTSEVWLVDADAPDAAPVVVEPREQGHEYHVEHHAGPAGDRLFVLTNADGAENFALAVTPVATPGRASWQIVLAHRDDTRLDDVDAFADFLVVSERADAVERLRVLTLGDDGAVADDHVLEMPEPVYSAWLGGNPEYDATIVRYQYTSLVSPASAYDYDPAARTATLVKRQPVPGYDPEQLREPPGVGHRARRRPGADLDRLPARPPGATGRARCSSTATARTRCRSTRRSRRRA